MSWVLVVVVILAVIVVLHLVEVKRRLQDLEEYVHRCVPQDRLQGMVAQALQIIAAQGTDRNPVKDQVDKAVAAQEEQEEEEEELLDEDEEAEE